MANGVDVYERGDEPCSVVRTLHTELSMFLLEQRSHLNL